MRDEGKEPKSQERARNAAMLFHAGDASGPAATSGKGQARSGESMDVLREADTDSNKDWDMDGRASVFDWDPKEAKRDKKVCSSCLFVL